MCPSSPSPSSSLYRPILHFPSPSSLIAPLELCAIDYDYRSLALLARFQLPLVLGNDFVANLLIILLLPSSYLPSHVRHFLAPTPTRPLDLNLISTIVIRSPHQTLRPLVLPFYIPSPTSAMTTKNNETPLLQRVSFPIRDLSSQTSFDLPLRCRLRGESILRSRLTSSFCLADQEAD